jgi:hypothetical protein
MEKRMKLYNVTTDRDVGKMGTTGMFIFQPNFLPSEEDGEEKFVRSLLK